VAGSFTHRRSWAPVHHFVPWTSAEPLSGKGFHRAGCTCIRARRAPGTGADGARRRAGPLRDQPDRRPLRDHAARMERGGECARARGGGVTRARALPQGRRRPGVSRRPARACTRAAERPVVTACMLPASPSVHG